MIRIIQALLLLLSIGTGAEAWQVGNLLQSRAQIVQNERALLSRKMRSLVPNMLQQQPLLGSRPGLPTRRTTNKGGLFASIPHGSESQQQREKQPLSSRHPARRFAIRCALSVVLALCVLVVGQAAAVASTGSGAAAAAVRLSEPPLTAMWELRLSMRLICAALTGAAIGKERSGLKYHPAGVRTMALVALGAALFTICSRHGFAGTHYDTSRMASNVASGVGFIGAGVIYHEQQTEVVHGLTTAAAIWISAAVGVTCGCGLYVLSTMGALATVGILRIGGAVKVRKRRKRKVPLEHNTVPSEEPEDDVFPPEPPSSPATQATAAGKSQEQQRAPWYPPPSMSYYPPAALDTPYAIPSPFYPSTSDYQHLLSSFRKTQPKGESGLDYSSKYAWLRDLDEREMHTYFLKSMAEFQKAQGGKNQTMWGGESTAP